jgi:hypothetical protein
MRRYEERERRAGHGMRDAAMRTGPPDRPGNFAVGDDFAEFEARDEPPRLELERRPGERKREIEAPQAPLKISADLRGRIGQERVVNLRARRSRPLERREAEPRFVPLDTEREAERRRQEDLTRARLR